MNHAVGSNEPDQLYEEAVLYVCEVNRVSTSTIQRKFRLGFYRASRLIEMMEEKGVISSIDKNGCRKVLRS